MTGLLTVDVDVTAGALVGGGFGERLAVRMGTMPLYGGDVRLSLQWPAQADDRDHLHASLGRFARITGAVVWAPHPGSRVTHAADCDDLVADGGGWEAYRPHPAAPLRFESDPDGRLIPAGGFVLRRFRGVAAVSVPDRRLRRLAAIYPRIRPRQGLAVADLTVLDDGRLAGICVDGNLVALGGARLRRMLGDPAARGADVALLARVEPRQLAGLRRYLREAGLGCAVYLPEPGSDIEVADDLPRAVTPHGPSSWRRLDDGTPPRWESRDGYLISVPGTAEPAPLDDRFEGPFFGPQLEPGPRGGGHGVAWLPERPQVNAVPFALYVSTRDDPADVAEHGLASTGLFAVGQLDPGVLAHEIRQGHLLRVTVGPQGAVDVPASEVTAPPQVTGAAVRRGAYLLPAGWLDRARIVAAIRVSGGELIDEQPLPPGPLRLRATGVAGLPDEACPWPRPGWRPYRRAYALLGVDAPPPAWLGLHLQPPQPRPGYRLATLRVRAGTAIDVAATAAHLASLPAVRSDAARLLDDGPTLLLPWRAYRYTRVVAMASASEGRWRRADAPWTSAARDLGVVLAPRAVAGRVRAPA
ncbi:hypothetical protein ACQEVZ_39855 [Dactylosporangium sp. CA-152071]|uniref:hypothetical protein n=1 Tax=Dactylosporangium sp. CA-152071 TaxID=3239933 RepID=UPI003D8F9CD1